MMRADTIRSATAGTPHAPLLPSTQGRQGCPTAESRRTLLVDNRRPVDIRRVPYILVSSSPRSGHGSVHGEPRVHTTDPIQPSAPRELAESLLAHVPEPKRVERRLSGRSGGQSWLVSAGAARFVLKTAAAGTPTRRWVTTLEIQRAAAARGIAPAVIASDPASRTVVTEHVRDESLMAAVFDPRRSNAALAALVDQIARLHGIDPSPFETDVTPLQRCHHTIDRLAFDLPAFARAPWQDLQRRPLAGGAQSLCHLDLNPTNILFDGQQAWLVDWDTAGPANRWLDLATVVNMLLLSDERTIWVLERYATRCGIDLPSTDEFDDARRLVYVAYGLAFLELVREPPARLPLGEASLSDCFGALHQGRLDLDSDAGRYQLAHAYFAGYGEIA